MEQKLTPNLMQLVLHDLPLRIGRLYLFLFTLISYLFAATIVKTKTFDHDLFFFIWLIAFAIAIDILRDSWRRILNFLTPSYVVSCILRKGEQAIRNDQKKDFLNDLNDLAEIAIHSIEKSKLALSTQTLQTFPFLLNIFFDSAKSISHISRAIKDKESPPKEDAASFVVFYLLQRLELINDKALKERQETVCHQMIMTLGKIIMHSAQFDLSMVSFPTHFLTKFGLKAQQHYFEEVTELTTSTLLEIGRTITTAIDLTYAELKEPFQSIINGLTAIARSTFKKEKNTNLKGLMQPLVDLKGLFQTEKLINHRDTPSIVQQINNVLDEFSVVEQMMQSIPTISTDDRPV